MYYEITYDTFNIANRLKEIDKNYMVKYNTKQKRFEIWYRDGILSHLELVVPYGELDKRTITKVLETRADKIDYIIMKMEQENQMRSQQLSEQLKGEITYKVKTILKY